MSARWLRVIVPRDDPTAHLENVALVFLVCLSIVFSSQLWFGSTRGYAVQHDPGYPLVEEAERWQVRELTRPPALLVHVGQDGHTAVPVEGDYGRLWALTRSLLFEDLPRYPEPIEPQPMTEAELTGLRQSGEGVEVDLYGTLPFNVWTLTWAKSDGDIDTGSVMSTLAQRRISRAAVFLLSNDGGDSLDGATFVMKTPDGLLRYEFRPAPWEDAGQLWQELQSVRRALEDEQLVPYRRVRSTVEGWIVSQGAYVPGSFPAQPLLIAVQNESVDVSVLRDWFFEEGASAKQVNDPRGGVFLQGERETAKANGTFMYEVSDRESAARQAVDGWTGLRLAVAAVDEFDRDTTDSTPLPSPEVRLARVTEDQVRGSLEDLSEGYQLRAYGFKFAHYLDSDLYRSATGSGRLQVKLPPYPLVSYHDELGWVQVRVNDRGIQFFSRTLWRVIDTFDESAVRIRMIEPEDAVEVAVMKIEEGLTGTPENPVVDDVYVGYYIGPEAGPVAIPVWAVKFADSTYGTVYVYGHRPEMFERMGQGGK